MISVNRRELLIAAGAAATTSSLVAQAQERNRIPQLGVLMGLGKDAEALARVAALRAGLEQLGLIDGKNLRIVERWSDGEEQRLHRNAAALVQLQPDVILANGARALSVLEHYTSTIPVVMVGTNDPAGGGFNAALSRPAGNVTGFTQFELSMLGKMIALLQQAASKIRTVGLLMSPDNPNSQNYSEELKKSAAQFGIQTADVLARSDDELDRALHDFGQQPNRAVLIPPDVFIITRRRKVLALMERSHLPAVGPFRSFALDGALLSYGTDLPELYRRAASYVSRILNGEKPGNLPIQAPTKFELVINLKTAEALGITVPATLIALADEVIE